MTPYETYKKAVKECLCSLCKTKQGDCDFDLCSAYSEIPKLRSLTLALLDGEIERLKLMIKVEAENIDVGPVNIPDIETQGYNQALEDSLSHLRSERELIANEK